MNIKLERVRMAEKLGRPLKIKEKVFHLSGDEADNRPENLILLDDLPKEAVRMFNDLGVDKRELLSVQRELKELRDSFLSFSTTKNEEKAKDEDKQEIPDWIRIANDLQGL